MIRAFVVAAFAFPLVCGLPVAAQQAPPPAATPAAAAAPSAEAPSAVEDEVVVVQGYRDRAMSAFLRGEFEVAEREFAANLSCIQRVETLRTFAFEQSRVNEQMADNNAAIGASLAAGTAAPTALPATGYGIHERRERVPERTCESPYWQHYMMGMSQIGLGRLDEAKATLYRVVNEANNQYFFDAHYRVGLLELLDGNIDLAERRLTHLRRMQRLCNRRGDSCEIRGELEHAIAQLDYSIGAARRGDPYR
jgi:tetratricopeptide (TPR) repeat protein